jgi:hypothetical protein
MIDWSKGRGVPMPGLKLDEHGQAVIAGPLVLTGMETYRYICSRGETMTPESVRLSEAEIVLLRLAAKDGVVPDVKQAQEYACLSRLGVANLVNGKLAGDGVRYHATQRGLDLLALLDGDKT